MKALLLAAALVLAGCGVDSASTAASAAAAKKQELEQSKRTRDELQQNLGKALERDRQSAERADEAK